MVAVLADNRSAAPAISPVHEATPEEGETLFDRRARRYLGISGAEFLQRWEAGHYDADPDAPGVQNVVALLPFVQHLQRAA